MAKKEKPNEYYTYVEVNKARRAGFFTVFISVFIMLTLVIAANLIKLGSWTTIVVPIFLFSLPVLLFPPIERWVYEPWQAKARKYERHYID